MKIGAADPPDVGCHKCDDVGGSFELQELAELYCEVIEEREEERSDWLSPLPVYSEQGLGLFKFACIE